MTINTTIINGYIHQADGSVREKSFVIFTQTGFDTDADDGAVVVSTPIRAPINADDGTINQMLWPNSDGVRRTYYNVKFEIYNGVSSHFVDGGYIEVPSSGGTYNLNDLLSVSPPPDMTREEWTALFQANLAASESNADRAEAAALNVGVTLEEHGALADGSDDAAAWESAMDALEAQGGGTLTLVEGRTYLTTAITIASNVTVNLNGATLGVHSSMPLTGHWLRNRDINTTSSSLTCNRPRIIGHGKIDGSARPFVRWLSQSNGTPVTDPDADYVMGSGALASGISGVSLTSVLTGNSVSSVTITNGGSGWNGHPTFPYLPNTVALKFVGDGAGAAGYATISGGTLTSVTITESGSGYTSPPDVETLGGYADVSLLCDPSVDRRNANYSASGNGIYFAKAMKPEIIDVDFIGFRCRAISDAGCFKGVYRGLNFTDCGKNDGAFHCIWVQSYLAVGGGHPAYAASTDVLIEGISASSGIERSLVSFSPAGGGTLRDIYADGCGESTIFINEKTNHDGGVVLIEAATLKNSTLTDIAAQLIEHGGAKDLTVRDSLLVGSSLSAVTATGGKNVLYDNVKFVNNGTAKTITEDNRYPYGPFSERFDFNSGLRPIAGTELYIPKLAPIRIGSLGTSGQDGACFQNCTFEENRSTYPSSVFAQEKSGTNNIAGDTSIIDNNIVNIPSDIEMIDTSVVSVWETTMPLHIRGNLGHVSEGPVRIDQQINSTGLINVDCGFRPSWVSVVAEVNAVGDFRASHGSFRWSRDGVRNDFVHSFATDGSTQRGQITDSETVRIYDPTTGTMVVGVEFAAWTETGFILSCNTYSALTNVRFVCYP